MSRRRLVVGVAVAVGLVLVPLLVFVTPHIIDPVHTATAAPGVLPMPVTPLDKNNFDKRMPGNKPDETKPKGTESK